MNDLIALCSSLRCVGFLTNSASKFIEKNVARGKCECPDCGQALVWRKMNKHRMHVVRYKRSKAEGKGCYI